MNISEHGLALVRRWEGLRLEAYRDVAGVWTIGYGTTDPEKARPGARITPEIATAWLREDLAVAERAVRKYVTVPLSQAQFDALVSFTYNVGAGALARSTLRRKLNAGDYDAVPAELAKWVHAGGRRVRGLINRRRDEADLWESGTGRPLEAEVAPGSVGSAGGEAKPVLRSRTLWGAVVGAATAAAPIVEELRTGLADHADTVVALGWGRYLPLALGVLGLAAATLVVVARLDDRKKA